MTKMQNQNPYHARVELGNKTFGESQVVLSKKKIGIIHAQTDRPGATFDLIVADHAGNEIIRRNGINNESDRWGEVIDKEVTDNNYIVKVENVKGASTIDIFLE